MAALTEVPDFDSVYRADPDPWRVRSSFYERRKLEVVLAGLSAEHYHRAWDPASGVGELAARLADRATEVLATDASVEAVRLTRLRCADLPSVEVRALPLPATPGAEPYDLVAVCEFLYYLDREDRQAALALIDSLTTADAELISVHWRHKPHDAWLSGADTQTEIGAFLRGRGWQPIVHHDDRDFVLDSFRRSPR